MPPKRLAAKAAPDRKPAQRKQSAPPAHVSSDQLKARPAVDLLQRAAADPGSLAPADVLALQRIGGNRAVGRLMTSSSAKRLGRTAVQFKLAVGPAGDRYEQEADRMAEKVMGMAAPQRPAVQRTAEEDEQTVQAKPLTAVITPLAQPAVEAGGARTKPVNIRDGFEAGREVEDHLSAQKGAGQPLPGGLRGYMEPRFGADFSQVRVHTGGEASQLNRKLGAQAFTHGQDIYLGEGKFSPGSAGGQRLLAHELTHVVQQTGGAVQRQAVLQRKIGFEFELDHWNTWQAVPGTELDEQTTVNAKSDTQTKDEYHDAITKDDINMGKWKRLPKGNILAENGDVEVTADDQGEQSDLELRTKALPDNDVARAQTAATMVKTVLDELKTKYMIAIRAAHYLRANELAGTLQNPQSFLRTMQPSNLRGKPQATVGLRLEALPSLIRNLYPDPNETGTERTRRGEGRQTGTGFNQAGPQKAGPILKIMGAAPGKAETAIVNFLPKHKNAPAPASGKLKGLVALLIAYMDMGKSGLVRSYAKTIAPVMARTDFATMFAMLPDTERDYYSTNGGDKFVDLLKGAGYSWYAMRGSIYSGGIKESQEPNQWYQDLTRKDWLKTMTAPSTATGTDRLTPANFPTAKGKAEIEGLGSYANRTDPVTTTTGVIDVPILELRSLPSMDPNTFVDFAVKLARLMAFLNQAQDKTFGEV